MDVVSVFGVDSILALAILQKESLIDDVGDHVLPKVGYPLFQTWRCAHLAGI
jgi:hypothetical protein